METIREWVYRFTMNILDTIHKEYNKFYASLFPRYPSPPRPSPTQIFSLSTRNAIILAVSVVLLLSICFSLWFLSVCNLVLFSFSLLLFQY